eukprot:15443750-Alexandrium_andersonii.AAC.1
MALCHEPLELPEVASVALRRANVAMLAPLLEHILRQVVGRKHHDREQDRALDNASPLAGPRRSLGQRRRR